MTIFAKKRDEMTAGKEIAGFALPFAAGAALAALIPSLFSSHPQASLSILLAIISACLLFLTKSLKTVQQNDILWISIIVSALCCGAICSIASNWLPASLSPDSIPLLNHASASGERLREHISSLPFKHNQTSALINSLITGDRSGLNSHTQEIFRASGASHILALSGMHLGIIYGILKFIFSPLGNSRKVKMMKSCLIMSTCFFYTIMTGAGPSIIRAFIFIAMYEIAATTGRRATTGEVLMSALIIQIMLFPEDILEVSFLLSYAAMAGIAFIFPLLNSIWPEDAGGVVYKGLKWIWASAAMSISCQLTTGPIAYAFFGTFPKYFILTNLLAAPLTGIIIPYSLAVAGLSAIGICHDLLNTGLEFMIQTLIGILEIISSL